jgi:hypothetical protein
MYTLNFHMKKQIIPNINVKVAPLEELVSTIKRQETMHTK